MAYPIEQDWTPPDYAGAPIEDSGKEWTPPSYAGKPIDEEKKPSLLSKIVDTIKPAEKIHPGEGPKAKIDRFLESVLSEKSSHPLLKRVLTSKEPGEEPLLPTTREAGDPGEPSTWGEGFAKGLYNEFIRPLSSAYGAAMMLGFQEPPDLSKHTLDAAKAAELPIQQRRFDPSEKLQKSTPQQDAVAIALTRDNVPRTPANISAETGIPKPLVRRTTSELRKKISDDSTIIRTNENAYEQGNQPTRFNRQAQANRAIEQERQRIAQNPDEYAGESIETPAPETRDFGYNERDLTNQTPQPLPEDLSVRQLRAGVPSEPIIESAPVTPAQEPPIKQTNKFVNPFEKKAVEETPKKPERGFTLSFLGAGQGEELLRIAKETGRDIRDIARELNFTPTEEELNSLYEQLNKTKLVGGAAIKSSKEWKPPEYAGKAIEEKPEPTRSPNLDVNRFPEEPTAGRPKFREGNIDTSRYTPEDIAAGKVESNRLLNKFGTKGKEPIQLEPSVSEEELTRDFGGSGHPESPEFIQKVLSKAGTGEPGLSIEPLKAIGNTADLNAQHIVYRDPKGNPIAVAKIVQDSKGKKMVMDLAADKSQGLLTGRAMKAIGDKLAELGATEPAGTISPDAQNFLNKMKVSYAKKSDLMDEFIKSVDTGPVKEGTPWLNEKGEIIGHTTNKEGSTGFKPLEEQAKPETTSEKPEELFGGLGGIKPSSRALEPNEGPYGRALDKLFNAMGKIKENRVQQDIINKIERARRFAKSAGVKEEGAIGAAKSLSAMKGEFEKVDLEKLQMTKPQVDSLFTAIKRAKITEAEKINARSSMFKILNGDKLPQQNELRILDDIFGNHFAEKVTQMQGGLGAVNMQISKISNTMKALMSSFDISMSLRQGIGLIHRPEWRNAVKEQLKYLAKPEYFNAAMQAIEEHPMYSMAKESGLFIAKPGGMINGEEAFMNNYIGELPKGIKGLYIRNIEEASERAYVGGLNKLRMDTYVSLMKLAKEAGNEVSVTSQMVNTEDMAIINRLKKFAKDNGISTDIKSPEFLAFAKKNGLTQNITVPTKISEDIAKYINVFTGRGGLGKLERISTTLNSIFWSPRLRSSRLTALFNYRFYKDLDPFVRKEAIKSLFAIASASTIMNTLGALAGGTVGLNILSSDFMKTRFKPSNNVLDPSGGYQQAVVAAARMIAEVNRMASGKKRPYNQPGILGIAGNYTANALNPLAGLGYDIVTASQFEKPKEDNYFGKGQYIDRYGNRKTIQNETAKRFVSMFAQDAYSILNSDPSFAELVTLLPLTALGAGEQNYSEKKPTGSLLLKKSTTLR